MHKIKYIIFIFFLLLPLASFAQVDFNIDSLINEPSDEADINLNSLKLAWVAETYAPYEYKGRTLPTQGSKVTVDAILDISGGSLNDLKYSWFLDDIFQESKSGYDRNSFQFGIRRTNGSSHTVMVKIFNESRSFMVERTIEIPIVQPEAIICFSNNGSYSSDRKNETADVFSNKKSAFIAKPYFFDIEKLSDLTFEWKFANQSPVISSAYSANVLDLVIEGKEDQKILENNLSLKVTNKLNSRQSDYQSTLVKIH
ncbi:MAG: hypothetical protein A2V60_00800 [Candidatus Portnoybacteria bacterium RIFCSPHIGHO2_01_FULL_39_19]|nr:MAG: hypothetical protein A2V60_00800 [Candidatus Portnoybacteria bacterium RIFCSPHIGHO2_01_FULL_39_19]